MKKPGQGGSKLHVQGKMSRHNRAPATFANYLRQNSGVKGSSSSPHFATGASAKEIDMKMPNGNNMKEK